MCFKRKNKKIENTKPRIIPCNHKYRDFPWYASPQFIYAYDCCDTGRLQIKIIKPYVCIYCGDRKNIEIDNLTKIRLTHEEAEKELNKFLEKYEGHIQPVGIVEEAINDMVLVDREYLKIVDNLRNGKLPFSEE